MIKAKHQTVASWSLGLMPLFFAGMLFYVVFDHYIKTSAIPATKVSDNFYSTASICVVLFISFLSLFLLFIKGISIDPNNKTISFINLISRKKKTYAFSYFDGYIDTALSYRGSNYDSIVFVKENMGIQYISSYYVSNLKELIEALNDIPCLGSVSLKPTDQLKLAFGKVVLE